MNKRNIGKRISTEQAKSNIVKAMGKTGLEWSKSRLGYVAFPDYSFKWPQGAAFAVAKIVKELEQDGIICFWSCSLSGRRGYVLAKAQP